MIKTIDTNEITEKMFQAFRDNYVDATRCIFAVLAAATAVEPAQRCNCCGYLVTDSEHKGCLRAAQQEPAQAVPFAWVLECMTSIGTTCWMLSWNRSGVGSCNRLHGQDHEKPLYTAPPAIDDETKRMVLELCDADN